MDQAARWKQCTHSSVNTRCPLEQARAAPLSLRLLVVMQGTPTESWGACLFRLADASFFPQLVVAPPLGRTLGPHFIVFPLQLSSCTPLSALFLCRGFRLGALELLCDILTSNSSEFTVTAQACLAFASLVTSSPSSAGAFGKSPRVIPSLMAARAAFPEPFDGVSIGDTVGIILDTVRGPHASASAFAAPLAASKP